MTLSDATLAVLRQALPGTMASVGPIAPVSLRIEGNAQARRVSLIVDMYLVADDTTAWRLRGQLLSEAWAPLGPLPPVGRCQAELAPTVMEGATAALSYTLAVHAPPLRTRGDQQWLKYLQPQTMLTTAEEATPDPLEEMIRRALQAWLTHSFPVATVGEAIEASRHGPIGHFGPVESRVLERSGQADLAVDATFLGEADDTAEQGGKATFTLTLYGERFGRWLLHRRTTRPVKNPPKNASVPPCLLVHEVVIAEGAEQLIDQAGLGAVEKRLFQRVNILPHATLWPDCDAQSSEASATESSSATATTTELNLSGVPDRPRRHLQAIALLAQQGRLDATDVDLLLKTARQLSKIKR